MGYMVVNCGPLIGCLLRVVLDGGILAGSLSYRSGCCKVIRSLVSPIMAS